MSYTRKQEDKYRNNRKYNEDRIGRSIDHKKKVERKSKNGPRFDSDGNS